MRQGITVRGAVVALGLFLPQGADAGAFLGDLQVAVDRVGADHVRVRIPGLFFSSAAIFAGELS